MSETASADVRSYRDTLQEYGRGLVGGMLFAFAPLYTMEVWHQGFIASPGIVLTAVGTTYAILVAYSYYVGLHTERSILANLAEALETVALGFAVAAIVLTLIGQLSFDLSAGVFLARLTLEGMVCAIGVAIGSAQLGADEDDEGEGQPGAEGGISGFIHQIAYTALGATVIIAGVAPTAEVVVTGVEAPVWAILATALLSLSLCLAITHALDFRGAGRHGQVYAGGSIGDAVVTYAISLVLAAALLWMTGRLGGVGLGAGLSMTVYLAWPAAIGGSIGRLLL